MMGFIIGFFLGFIVGSNSDSKENCELIPDEGLTIPECSWEPAG
jgi:hypothetical protein